MTKTPSRRAGCPVCAQTYAVTLDGRIRAHDISPGRRCRGSGAKMAKTRKAARKSIPDRASGLPSLGKRSR